MKTLNPFLASYAVTLSHCQIVRLSHCHLVKVSNDDADDTDDEDQAVAVDRVVVSSEALGKEEEA